MLSNLLSSRKRLALTLGFPSGETKMDFVRIWKDNYKKIKPIPAKFVKKSQLFDNVYKDGDIDMFKFPTPFWHDKDKGFNSRAIVDATRPYEWMKDFPPVAKSSKEVLDATAKKWGAELFGTNGKK